MTADDTPSPEPGEIRTQRRLYQGLLLAGVGLLALGTLVFHALEDWTWVDSFYFSAIAVTTVGFGDLTPTTDTSKLFTVFYVLAGISIVARYLDARIQHHALRRGGRGRHRAD